MKPYVGTPLDVKSRSHYAQHMAAARTKGVLKVPRTKPALPPRLPRQGRPYSTSTNLGKIMAHRDFTVMMVQAQANLILGPRNGLNNRVLSDYLNGHKDISAKHRAGLAKVLDVEPKLL